MKKIINITLGNRVFAIETDAYEKLSLYFEQIKTQLLNTDDKTEIIADIEDAIAEKFSAFGRSEKQAVRFDDVEQVQAQMGTPADFGDTENTQTFAETSKTTSEAPSKRRLYRDVEEGVLTGVAAGIANYFSIDPVIVRIVFITTAFINGLGILAYLILWLVVPAAKTTEEKYSMHGERVTLHDISARVKKNVADSGLHNPAYVKGVWVAVRDVIQKIFVAGGSLIKLIIIIAGYAAGLLLLLAAVLGTLGLVTLYSLILFSNLAFLPIPAQTALGVLLDSTLGIILISASFIVAWIPLLVMSFVALSILFQKNQFTRTKVSALLSVWLVALVIVSSAGVVQFEKIWPVIDELRIDIYKTVNQWDDDNWEEYYQDSRWQERKEPSQPDVDWREPTVPPTEAMLPPTPVLPSPPPVTSDKSLPVTETRMCTADVKQCSDGSFVSRSPIDCSFAPCPPALSE